MKPLALHEFANGFFNIIKGNNMHHSINKSLELLGIGRTKFYQELNAGRIKAIKVGTRTLIPQESIDSWLASLPAYPVKGGQGDDQ